MDPVTQRCSLSSPPPAADGDPGLDTALVLTDGGGRGLGAPSGGYRNPEWLPLLGLPGRGGTGRSAAVSRLAYEILRLPAPPT